ncbi:cation:proton antiporter [Liquorilactobacillus capillatus]|uniref:NhaP-type Na+ H+ and K+ H+ antiporter n=1 Tax=Liquorilactobacillus capillatus DSM 19910 TaxID=1423731 RepID=A0A0R1M3Q8_9LACO|nr:sodium:proton antiporter [Liquorilactobacillus capillatus]KRL02662.1 NhaP-type Na+ H+ and K+ H+ antiporter [Liquorilactobacillus capillatus DSM 19910]
MTVVETVILLVALVLVSNLVNHYFKTIPVSLIQIFIGTTVALVFNLKIDLNSSWFLLLFIAPLLYNDGRKFPKHELWKLKGAIINNAIILVFITILVGGYLIYLVIPSLPLPVSFALAAVLAPTDPVAVHSISKQVKLPDNILHLVSGESLINDASGLIGFKYALGVAVTGYFSFSQAIGDFFYMASIGLLAGIILINLVIFIIEWLVVKGFNDVIFNTVLQVSVPFIVYLLTEKYLHASGVIAVVVAGVFFSSKRATFNSVQPEINLVSERMWDIIVYLLNGTMFTILGVELPVATMGTIKNERISTPSAILLVFIVWFILLAIRVIWTYCYQLFDHEKSDKSFRIRFKIAMLSGLSGVRGAITMAAALTIPLHTLSGEVFPERALVLFIAAGVIILSMIMAIVTLPMIAGHTLELETRGGVVGLEEHDDSDEDEDSFMLNLNQAKLYILKSAVRSLEEQRRMNNQLAVYHLILEYQHMIKSIENDERGEDETLAATTDEIKLRKVALKGQLMELQRLFRTNQIHKKSYLKSRKNLLKQLKNVDHIARIRQTWLFPTFGQSLGKILRRVSLWNGVRQDETYGVEMRFIERTLAKAAIKSLSEYLKNPDVNEKAFNREVIYHLIIGYRNIVEKQKSSDFLGKKEYQDQIHKLRFRSVSAQRLSLQYLVEQGYITHQIAIKLQQYINHEESLILRSSGLHNMDH